MITPEQVRQWARLSRLDLPDSELERLQGDLEEILEFVRSLQDVEVGADDLPFGDLGAIETRTPVERRDEVGSSLPREEALREARSTADGHFAVPAVVESEARYESRTGGETGGESTPDATGDSKPLKDTNNGSGADSEGGAQR